MLPPPCLPCRTSPRCSLLCRGRAPQLRSIQDVAKAQGSPGPPGRLRLLCVRVCVLGDMMFLCRLMCFLLSGRLPFAMRLLPRSVVLAAVLLSLSVSVSGARVICCSPTPRCSGCALVVCCTVRTVCAKVALRVRVCGCLRFAFGRPLVPAYGPHHTTPIHHTPHPPRTTSSTLTPHTTLHSLLRICKSEMAFNSLYTLGDALLCLIKSIQSIQNVLIDQV
jgi:hypothetical protein